VALTNLSIAYRNAEYIYDQIFPFVPVAKQTNKYFTFGKSAWYRDETAVRAPGTRAARADYTLSTDSYLCVEKALAKQVPIEVIENSDDPLTPFTRATEYVTDQIMKAQEISVLGDVFGTGWTSSATPSPTWDDDTSNPLGDMETAMISVAALIGREPNIAVMGRQTWRYLKNHPDIIDRLKYGQTAGGPAAGSLAGLAALVGIDKILVSAALKDSGNEGGTASLDFIAGKHMWFGYVTPSPALDSPTAGYIFTWKSRVINRYNEDQEHADVVECLASWDTKVTAADAGYLCKSAVA